MITRLACSLGGWLLALSMRPGRRYTDSLRWDILRGLIRKRDGYCCRECGRRAEYGGVWLEVHHRRPVAEGGSHAPWNLTLVCKAHHDGLHQKR